MKSKIMMFLILFIICIIVLSSVTIIFAIFAAKTHTMSSNISVTFKSERVRGKASAKYYVGENDKTGKEMRVGGVESGETIIDFNARNENENTILSPVDQNINFNDTHHFVVFEYYFINTSPQNDFRATLNFSGQSSNVELATLNSEEKLENFYEILHDIGAKDGSTNEFTISCKISSNSKGYVYIGAFVQNLGQDANFFGNFNWVLVLVEPTLDKLKFTLAGNHYEVQEINSSISGDVVIPSIYRNVPVTVLPELAFYNCNITSIDIPTSITKIGKNAFKNSKLRELKIPSSVTTIENGCFANNDNLVSATIEGNGETSIGEQSFYECKSLRTLIIGDGVKTFGNLSFRDCSNLVKVTIGTNVTNLSDAFFGCSSITEILNKSSLELEKGNVLGGAICSYPERIITEESQKGQLKRVEGFIYYLYEDNIVAACPVNRDLTTVNLLQNITTIKRYGFDNCKNLTSITIPPTVKSIQYSAFEYCVGFTEIIIPHSVDIIEDGAFYRCSKLSYVKIVGSGTTFVEDYAFAYNGALETVVIGRGIASMGGYSFAFSNKIKEIIIESIEIYTLKTRYETEFAGGAAENLNKGGVVKVPKEIVNSYECSYLNDSTKFSLDADSDPNYVIFTALN